MAHWIIETTKCKQCGKVSYANQEDAEYAADKIAAKLEHERQIAYECFYKNGWHLTTDRKVPLHGRRLVSKTGAR